MCDKNGEFGKFPSNGGVERVSEPDEYLARITRSWVGQKRSEIEQNAMNLGKKTGKAFDYQRLYYNLTKSVIGTFSEK